MSGSEIKFMYSEKATKFCEIFPLLSSYVVGVKSRVKISQKNLAFSEYMIFKNKIFTTKILKQICNLIAQNRIGTHLLSTIYIPTNKMFK